MPRAAHRGLCEPTPCVRARALPLAMWAQALPSKESVRDGQAVRPTALIPESNRVA
jgi:hypothetical protein